MRAEAVLLAALVCAPAPGARAQDAGAVDRESTAPGPRLSDAGGASVTRVEREQIEALGLHGLGEVLRLLPGVHVDERGGRSGVSSAYVRGGEANYTVFLVDGVPVNDPTSSRGGSFDLALLGTSDLERVEVARGVVPVSWGAAAMAGAVRVVTADPPDDGGAALDLSAGRDGYHREAVSGHGRARVGAGGAGRLDWRLGYTLLDEGIPVPGSEHTRQSGRAALGWHPGDGLHLRASLRAARVEREAYADGSGGPRHATTRAIERRDMDWRLASLRLEHEVSDRLEWGVGIGLFDQREDLESPRVVDPSDPFNPLAGFPAGRSDTDFTRTRVDTRARWTPRDGLTLSAGADVRYERGSSRGQIDLGGPLPTRFSLERDVISPWVELEIEPLPGLSLGVGLRHEMPRREANELLPRVALLWERGATRLRASWGRGYKLPAFFSLADPVVGNPGLRPERSETFELGIGRSFGSGRVLAELTWFAAEYDDLIDFDFGSFSLLNRARVESRGLELALGARLTRTLALSASATHLRLDLDPGRDRLLRNRPGWRGSALVRWQPGGDRLDVALAAVAVGRVDDESIPTGPVELDRWARLDATVRWRVARGVVLSLHAENLLDSEYAEQVGFDGPGFSLRAGIRVER